MPRNKYKGRRKRKPHNNDETDEKRPRLQDGGYTLTTKENELMLKYYKEQGIVEPDEWEAFITKLKEPLPVSFRISAHRGQSADLLNVIKEEYFSHLADVEVDGEKLHPPQCLPWYPGGLAWQINTTKKAVGSHDAFNRLHNFLVAETESGNVSRQETVSMIPPVVMDIQPHHKVLDMCASPGSKTAQLIEYLHPGDGSVPDGLVVANDSDNNRCYLMVHQVKRLQSPCFLVINHDACTLPKIILPSAEPGMEEFMLYDRVLADVPCSGDGTIRKNVDVWKKWLPVHGYNLMGLQMRILKRGLELLKIGGRIVYSTCSMNPVEDEAVIYNMLKDNQGAVRLLDVADSLPGLKYTKGLTTWKLMNRDGDIYTTMDDVPEDQIRLIRPAMFPPSPEVAAELNLDRCMRILPHQQNTGAFFVAVIEKVAKLPGAASAEPFAAGTLSEHGSLDKQPMSQMRKRRGYKEDPFLFFTPDDPIWPEIRKFYGIPNTFPLNQLMYRSHEGKRSVYFASEVVRHIITLNEHRLKVINTGVKVFGKCPSPHVPDCNFRANHEGLPCVYSYLLARQITMSREDIITFVTLRNPYFESFSEATKMQLTSMSPGSTIFRFTPKDSDAVPRCKLTVAGWCGKMSVRAFVNKHDRFHLLSLCGIKLEEIHKIMKTVQELPLNTSKVDDAAMTEGDGTVATSTSQTDDDDKAEVEATEHSANEGDKDMLGDGTEPVHVEAVGDTELVGNEITEHGEKLKSTDIDDTEIVENNGLAENTEVASKASIT